jgi:hypothetical protein
VLPYKPKAYVVPPVVIDANRAQQMLGILEVPTGPVAPSDNRAVERETDSSSLSEVVGLLIVKIADFWKIDVGSNDRR